MVLVDTSVWVNHFKNTQQALVEFFGQDLVSVISLNNTRNQVMDTRQKIALSC